MDYRGQKYWVIGASEGLGRAVAQQLHAQGAQLILSARSAEKLVALAADLGAHALPMDIADLSDCKRAVAEAGHVDGVILAAGVYWPSAPDTWEPEQIETMCNINFTGIARVLSLLVPDMVARDTGHIVLIGSLSGFRGLPGAFGYASSKAGMMHMAESLQAELHRTNVRVQLINPGFIRTRLTAKNGFRMPFILSPEAAARAVIAAMARRRFQTSFPWVFSLLFRGSRFLPASLYYRFFGR